MILIYKTSYKEHRLAWLYMTGAWPASLIDHINMIGSDNRWSNLRAATNAQNKQNIRVRRDSRSGIKGVRQLPNGRWVASICSNGKDHYLGYFQDRQSAINAYRAGAARFHTHNSVVREVCS